MKPTPPAAAVQPQPQPPAIEVFDRTAAALALAALSPLLALIAACVKLDSKGPVIYRAERVGHGGGRLVVFKFRSMLADRPGPAVTGRGDPRVTRVGRWLRKFKLDELPQLVNVLRGEMSLVGPRPEDPRYVRLYSPRQLEVLAIKPGVTSPASVAFRHEEELLGGADWERVYLEEILPRKIEIELEYQRDRGLGSHLRVLWETAAAILRPRPSDPSGPSGSRGGDGS